MPQQTTDAPQIDAAQFLTKVERLAAWHGQLRDTAQLAQAEAAAERVRLGRALTDALAERAEALLAAEGLALARYVDARRGRVRRKRSNRLSKLADRVLVRLRSIGSALVLARSGVWRASGRGLAARLFDLRMMAAYARRGPAHGVPPAALFDQDWYIARYPDVAAGRRSPLIHYLTNGGREGRSPHPLFNGEHYLAENAEAVGACGLTPLAHFVLIGCHEGRNPHPLFDVAYYVAQAPELAASGEDPVSHYLREGSARGLSPHPLFSPAYYRAQLAPGEGEDRTLLAHYLTVGADRGLKPHPLVDPAWYREQGGEAPGEGPEPLTHYLTAGAAEGRDPSPWFDTGHYVAVRGEALAAGVNPLVDYVRAGAWRVGEARPGFPTAAYVAANADKLAVGVTPLEHWAGLAAP
ncbi:hypothetical protein [Phenylobacterium sp.]|uniref:hypothetical protein n=1 Tax=Phenylobacterium sp. TaxID=1871053 RepID=UPI0035B0DABA